MNDQFWQGFRYLLIGGGMYLAGQSGGKISASDVMNLADLAMTAGPALVSLATAGWGFYVKFRTRAVPEKVAARADVPTVSAATGAVE